MARRFAAALDLEPTAIQFTPDLMPADITGTTVLTQESGEAEGRGCASNRGRCSRTWCSPTRSTAPRRAPRARCSRRCRSSTVTIANTTHLLPQPFFVLATQNPVEMYGTYPLPEAELDRFFLKLRFEFPPIEELNAMVDATTGGHERRHGEPVADADDACCA